MRIMVYGDSNSWGYLEDGSSQLYAGRWPRQMVSQFDAEVIEECQPGRVTCSADPMEGPHFDGTAPLLAMLMSHQPLDHVIIMLGTNDMKARFDRSAEDITAGVMQLVDIVQSSGAGRGGWNASMVPMVHVICPPALGDSAADKGRIKYEEWLGGWKKSRMLAGVLGRACHTREIDFIDANEFVVSLPDDPIHWQATTHQEFGNDIAAHMKVLATGGGRLG